MNIITFSKEAKVSVATVSRAMNPKTAHLVKDETRSRILELAAKLNFSPHPGARTLRNTSSAPIAVLLPRKPEIMLSEYYARLLSGIVHVASSNDLAVHTIAFAADSADINDQLNAATVGCGGIIYLSSPLSMRALIELERFRLPFAAIAGGLPPEIERSEVKIPIFEVNDFNGGRLAAEHLISLGHRNIALLNGPQTHRDACKRREGIEAAMADHKLVVRSDWSFEAKYRFESGVEHAEFIAPLLPTVTAVVCGNDEIAMGLIRGLACKGIRCPSDVSVIGYDDALWAARHSPALTTIRQPWMEMAEGACQMIKDLGEKKKGKKAPANIIIEPTLIERETTIAPSKS